MKRSSIVFIALIVIVAILLPTLASCSDVNDETTDSTAQNPVETTESETLSEDTMLPIEDSSSFVADKTEVTSENEDASTESDTDSSSVTDSDTETDSDRIDEAEKDDIPWVEALPLEGEYASSIELANKYDNGVNVSYTSGARDNIFIENKNMGLTYSTSAFSDKLIASIKNASGKSYIENTMDVFVKMKGNDTLFYASGSNNPALMNVYRYGYYYYQVLIDGQDFTDTVKVEKVLALGLSTPDNAFDLASATPTDKNAIA